MKTLRRLVLLLPLLGALFALSGVADARLKAEGAQAVALALCGSAGPEGHTHEGGDCCPPALLALPAPPLAPPGRAPGAGTPAPQPRDFGLARQLRLAPLSRGPPDSVLS